MSYNSCIADMLSVPDGPLWIIFGWLTTAFLSYEWGRILEKRNRKDAAQVLLISQIMGFIHKSETSDDMIALRKECLAVIESSVFEFVARAKGRKADCVRKALKDFRDIDHTELSAYSIKDFEMIIVPEKLLNARRTFFNALTEIKTKAETA